MARATGHPGKQFRRERQRAAAEARASARRRRARRRTLGYVLAGAALVAAATLAIVATGGKDTSAGVGPSETSEITVSGPARAEPLAAGDVVPAFAAPAVGGGTVSWADYDGTPAVLSVWAPWCPHCQVELPVVDRVMSGFPDVAFVTVVTSIGDHPGPDPGSFLVDNDIDARTAVDDAAGTIAGTLGIRGFPTLYFVASDGTVVRAMEGEVDEETLRSVIGSLS